MMRFPAAQAFKDTHHMDLLSIEMTAQADQKRDVPCPELYCDVGGVHHLYPDVRGRDWRAVVSNRNRIGRSWSQGHFQWPTVHENLQA